MTTFSYASCRKVGFSNLKIVLDRSLFSFLDSDVFV